MVTTEVTAGVADGDDLGVRRRVIGGNHLIAAAPYDPVVLHHNGSKWAARTAPDGFQ